jgi:hypothetical protein
MSNITLALDGGLIKASRKMAARSSKTLNGLIREYLENATRYNQGDWFEHYEAVTKGIKGHSRGWKFNREEEGISGRY